MMLGKRLWRPRRGHSRTGLGALVIPLVPLVLAPVCGCRGKGAARWWPPAAQRVEQRDGDTYLGFDVDDNGRLDYLQRVRHGYIDRLYFPNEPGGTLRHVVERPAADPSQRPALILLLDGVAYDRIAALRRRGHFRLFRPPARLVSTFPTVTDVAYDTFFGCGPTPGYEAGYFDRARNRLTNGTRVYLRGGNERWVRYSDYRIDFLLDALMYLYPKGVFTKELRTARQVLDARLREGRQHVVIYILATDGLGHMFSPTEIEQQLVKLDAWLERVVYDWRGEIEIVTLADHGMSTTPTERFRLRDVLRAAGLRVANRLARSGDVAVPLFGLLDVARVHTFDQATRDRVLQAVRDRPEIELTAWRTGEGVCLRTASGEARITARDVAPGPRIGRPHNPPEQEARRRLYKYEPIAGDPLDLTEACDRLHKSGQMDDEGYAEARAWLLATADADFPAAVPRLWDGMQVSSDERPDIVLSLSGGWFVGSGLFAAFAEMQGTHGGLHRRTSLTFAMATGFDIPSPISLEDAYAYVSRRLGWASAEAGPAASRAKISAFFRNRSLPDQVK